MGNKIIINVKDISIVLLIVLVCCLIIKDWTDCIVICMAIGSIALYSYMKNKENISLYPEDLKILANNEYKDDKTFLFAMVGPIERLEKKISIYKDMVNISPYRDEEFKTIIEFRNGQLMSAYVGCVSTYEYLTSLSKYIKKNDLVKIKKRILEGFIEIRSYDGFLINKMDNPEIYGINPNKILKELDISLKRLEEIEKSLNNK